MTIILAILGILFGALTFPPGLVIVVVDAFIIYYMTRPNIKSFFKPVTEINSSVRI